MTFRISLIGILLVSPAFADPLGMRAYDGDTGAPTVRWTIDGALSFDTPEVSYRHGAKCDLEIERGKRARVRFKEIVEAADHFEPVFLFNDDGTIARTLDRRRLLAAPMADGVNVGHILEAEGLAMIYDWQSEAIDWCSGPPRKHLK